MRGMNRPALQLRRLVAVAVRLVRAAGSVPMWALYVMTAMASISRSDWAFSMLARAWALAWSGIAMAVTKAEDGQHNEQFDESETALADRPSLAPLHVVHRETSFLVHGNIQERWRAAQGGDRRRSANVDHALDLRWATQDSAARPTAR